MTFRVFAIAAVVGIAVAVGVRLMAGPKKPISWPEVFAWIQRDWPEVPQITTAELARKLAASGESAPLLIDTRSRREYEVSHLRGAVWAESAGEIEAAVARVPRARPVVLYCSVGVRSSKAAAKLMRAGRGNVFDLQGSIFQWANEGREVVRDGRAVAVVDPYDERWGTLLAPKFHPVGR